MNKVSVKKEKVESKIYKKIIVSSGSAVPKDARFVAVINGGVEIVPERIYDWKTDKLGGKYQVFRGIVEKKIQLADKIAYEIDCNIEKDLKKLNSEIALKEEKLKSMQAKEDRIITGLIKEIKKYKSSTETYIITSVSVSGLLIMVTYIAFFR